MAYHIKITSDYRWQCPVKFVQDQHFHSAFFNSGELKLYDPADMPSMAAPETGRKRMTDFIVVQTWMAVSQRVRDKIEELEPNRHQLFPFTVQRKRGPAVLGPDGNELQTPYYLLNVANRADTIDVDQSILSDQYKSRRYPENRNLDNIVLSKQLIGDMQIWEGVRDMPGYKMISDQLGEWIISSKMKGIDISYIKEIQSQRSIWKSCRIFKRAK
ncbi:imm11 family protein [Sandaracinobacteroides hominis]|uniref:imm11 family protein n=1 Tax=Sandaracinobacteroides hominis TaxID=2780086 RepID=UPI0018F68E43|nr:DUF1629 domain-containing protein [Sandaracinobacteroides hominis]